MKRFLIAIFALLAPLAAAETRAQMDTVVVCHVTGMIDQGISVIVQRAIKDAEKLGAKAIIFRIDTPGGRIDSAIEIATAIQDANTTTIAYVEGMGAISAGALISFACDHIIMEPGSAMGAAAPVTISMEGSQPLGEKETSFVRAKMRALAESRGHNPDIAQAMVDKDIELRARRGPGGEIIVFASGEATRATIQEALEIEEEPQPNSRPFKTPLEYIIDAMKDQVPAVTDDETPAPGDVPEETAQAVEEDAIPHEGSVVVLPAGKLLTLTPREAQSFGVIETTANTIEEAAAYYGIENAEFIIIEATWAEKTFRWLTSPTIAGILMLVGLAGLYLEIQTPGVGLPGIIGAACLALLLGAHFVLGLTDVIDIVLIVAGILLILVEIFVLPGFGLAGAAGILLMIAGLYMSLVNFTIPQFSWEFTRLGEVGYSMGLAMVLLTLFIIVTWRFLPQTPFYGSFVLLGSQDVKEGYTIQSEEAASAYIGLKGVATSMLRPTGRGRFNDRTLQIVSRGDFIEPGTPIVIVEAEGNRYVVEAAPKENN